MNVEFYTFNDELWYTTDSSDTELVDEGKTEIIHDVLEKIRERYPDAYKSLCEIYKSSASNVNYYKYLIVRRFLKCNAGELDTTKFDINEEGHMNFEKVRCPLRGECKYEGVICCPRFNTQLSESELRVMEYIYKGHQIEDAAERLFLSPHTVKNHIKSVYSKLGIHEKSEFIKYANKNNLFS